MDEYYKDKYNKLKKENEISEVYINYFIYKNNIYLILLIYFRMK